MRSTSSKPLVVTSPVFAPFLSMSVLIPIVLPWIAEEMPSVFTPVEEAICSIPSRTPRARSSGVVRTFMKPLAPVLGSKSIRSVKVPPMSTPSSRSASWVIVEGSCRGFK